MKGPSTAGARRVNASLLVQRLNTIPVTLHPRELNNFLLASKRHEHPSPSAAGDRDGEQVLLLASPVAPLPPTAGNVSRYQAADGGLGANDLLLVGRAAESREAVTEWMYTTAAAHALRGGRVVYVHAPGSGSLQLRHFAECMERLVVRTSAAPGEEDDDQVVEAERREQRGGESSGTSASDNDRDCDKAEWKAMQMIQQQQQRVLAAMGRVDAVHCHSVEDLYAFSLSYQIPTEEPSEDNEGSKPASGSGEACVRGGADSWHPPPRKAPRTTTAATGRQTAVHAVPLILIDGCGGENSYLYRYERAAGVEVPLRHWLLCLLQRRTRCALVLAEHVSAAQQRRQSQILSRANDGGGGDGRDSLGRVTHAFARESDLVTRLLAPHQHKAAHPRGPPPPADHLRSSLTNTPATVARREKKRPPALLIHDDDTGGGSPFFQPPPQLQAAPPSSMQDTATELPPPTAAQRDQQLPVADIGGYTITYLSFGTATVFTSDAAERQAAILATRLRNR